MYKTKTKSIETDLWQLHLGCVTQRDWIAKPFLL